MSRKWMMSSPVTRHAASVHELDACQIPYKVKLYIVSKASVLDAPSLPFMPFPEKKERILFGTIPDFSYLCNSS